MKYKVGMVLINIKPAEMWAYPLRIKITRIKGIEYTSKILAMNPNYKREEGDGWFPVVGASNHDSDKELDRYYALDIDYMINKRLLGGKV